jgi:hypothetical protein
MVGFGALVAMRAGQEDYSLPMWWAAVWFVAGGAGAISDAVVAKGLDD